MSPATSPAPTQAPQALRHRRSARRLTAGQLASFGPRCQPSRASPTIVASGTGRACTACHCRSPAPTTQSSSCPGTAPTSTCSRRRSRIRSGGHPAVVGLDRSQRRLPGDLHGQRSDGRRNPLFDSPIQPAGRERPSQKRTTRAPGAPARLPTGPQVEAVLANSDFLTFQTQLESIHDGVHVWAGGTMQSIATAAYDPVFWAHHCMIDRLWYLWQLRHGTVGVPARLLDRALAPFPVTVRETLDVSALGYDYAASTAAAKGPGHHG